ncbi:MAG TPA: hypothetical protein VM899_09325 [Rubellimicrobium sp.]|nr:hypothetical protein [Rubellimicrobium sp.]
MRMKPARSLVAATLAAALLGGGLAACGDDSDAAAPASDSKADTTPGGSDQGATSSAALTPKGTGNPFADAITAAGHMPMTAKALAGGIATATKMKGSADSDAAELRSGLTYLLTEHVYLAGIAVATAYHAGADSPEFQLAAEAVDDNSTRVAAAIGAVAPDEEQGFLERWRNHVTDFVNYAVAAKTKDDAGKKKAVSNLTAYAKSSGAFFEKISGGTMKAKDVEAAFNEHIGGLAKAVDLFATGDTKAYAALKTAAAHMPMMAEYLADGVDKATKGDGDPNDEASALRATLTDYLTSHVYLAGVAVFTAYTAGADSGAFKASAAAVDTNSKDIAEAVGSIAGKDKGDAFYTTWAKHVSDFVDYAVADAANDQAKKDSALANLDAYRKSSGAFFETITNGTIPASAVEEELKMHIETTAGVIDSLKAALVK